MKVRLVCKSVLAAGMTAALLGIGVAVAIPGQSGAAIHKKHPSKKHHGKHSTNAAKTLKALGSKVAKEKGATFQVVYKITSEGHSQSITFAQAPPKFLMKTTSGSLIYTGTESLYCTATTCVGAGSTDPFQSLKDLFSPTTAEDFFHEAEAETAAAKAAGYSFKFSSATFGGLKSECASVKANGVSEKYCVANIGLLTYDGGPTGSVQITTYSSSVPNSDFTPPTGATVITSGATG